MDSSGCVPGAGALVEGQRLLAKRRGPILSWMRNHPRGVNILLAVVNVLVLFLNYLFVGMLIALSPEEEQAKLYESMNTLLTAAFLFILGTVFTVAIFFRERWHLQLLLATGVVGVIIAWLPTVPDISLSGVSSWVFIYTLASRSEFKRAIYGLMGFTVLVLAMRLYVFFFPDVLDNWFATGVAEEVRPASTWSDVMIMLGGVAFSVLICVVIFMVGRANYRSRMFELSVIAGLEQNQLLAATEERNRIAREMHDVVAHSLTVMITLADGARFVSKKNPQQAEEVLKELASTGRKALADMRRTLGVLRNNESAQLAPAEGISENAVDNLRGLVESFESTGLRVAFEHEGADIPDDNNLRLSLYRIVQESLTNALRYGKGAKNIFVKVSVDLPDIWLSVLNDGDPVEETVSSWGSGKGITGMKERAAFHDGTVRAGALGAGGWQVKAHLKSINN